MRKKAIFIVMFFIFLSLVILVTSTYSLDCNEETAYNCLANNNCTKVEEICIQQQDKDNGQIYDAQAQLRLINIKYDLAVTQFRQTEQKIETTQKEIDILNSRIEGLDNSLNYLSGQLLKRVAEGYKNRSVSLFNILLSSDNASDFISRIKYLKTAQNNNQKILVQVQETKLNFEEQKKLRDEKKAELDKLKIIFAQQQIDLQNQKKKKDEDIASYQNNLAETQRTLNIARQQIAGFKSFVSSAGVGIISANSLGNGSDGNYYSQRDERWANRSIGYSSESILNVGCLVTSVAITAKKLGSNVNPSDIASDVGRFFGNTAYMRLPWPGVAGKSYVDLGTNWSAIDQELQNGNYVIVGILRNSCASGGDHFVVLTKKDGDSYIMHDPVYGPDKKFSDYYSTICSSATFK